MSTIDTVKSYSVAGQETTPYGLALNSDGTKMYVLGSVGDDVNEYALSTAYDVSSATYTSATAIPGKIPTPVGLLLITGFSDLVSVIDNVDLIIDYDLNSAQAPTFSSITQTGAIMTWVETDSSENLYGYGIQISTDDVTYVNVIENTYTNNVSYLLDSLNPNTQYYLKWRNMYYSGSPGDWSSAGTFTTLNIQNAGGGGGGAGGGITPVKNIKNTIPEEDMTEEFQPPPEKVGLSALSLFQTNKEIIAPGETKKALLQIVWQGDTNLLIKEIIADESTGLKFAFQQPIEFPSLGTGNQTSNIPYVLEAPAEICETEQTANCIWSEAEYDIPVKIFAKSNGEDISFNSRLTVQVTTGFDFNLQQLVLLIIGLLVLAVILGRKRKPKRENALRHNSRPKTRKSK